MSELKVNKITPKTGTSIQLGESGDTITIPCGATLTNNGTATGFGLSFCTTVKTSPFTATANKGFLINTGSAVTVTLPASPTTGSEVIIVDQTGQAATNAITLGRNGSKIKGGCNDLLLATDRGGLRLVYSGSSQGWITATAGNDATATPAFMSASGGTETTSGNYKIHTFTSDGTFTVSRAAATPANNEVSYLVVAGGGGGAGDNGGGGGAGGFRESKSGVDCYSASPLEGATNVSVTAQAYPITIGAGGTAGSAPAPYNGTSGADSVFTTVTSAGGGRGGTGHTSPSDAGAAGGSGGGGGRKAGGSGAGNTPPVSPPQGSAGGAGPPGTSNCQGSGGGGGATVVGVNGKPTSCTGSGCGGAGAGTGINPATPVGTPGPSGPLRYFAGGGGGSLKGGHPQPQSTGGVGGGGNYVKGGPATAGTTNTGGGGAGDAAGGSGIVIIRYKYQ